jgi:hypothetical protein
MRRTLIGLGAAGALLVAGCGDDDDSGTTAGGGDGDTAGFCEQFLAYDEQFSENDEATEEEVIEAIRSLEPPEEIRGDFDTLLEGLDELSSIDTSDPEAAAGMQEQMAEYTGASQNIQQFVDRECGGSDDTTADSSADTTASDPTVTSG